MVSHLNGRQRSWVDGDLVDRAVEPLAAAPVQPPQYQTVVVDDGVQRTAERLAPQALPVDVHRQRHVAVIAAHDLMPLVVGQGVRRGPIPVVAVGAKPDLVGAPEPEEQRLASIGRAIAQDDLRLR